MLVVARKFNDIFYAMSSVEWGLSKRHDLLILSFSMEKEDFPFIQLFDDVNFVRVPSNAFHSIYSVFKIYEYYNNRKYNYITLSNVAIVSNLFLLKIRKEASIILLEDGTMNYCNFMSSRRPTKRLYEFLLGINENKIVSSIHKTYLLLPEEAKYYYGSVLKLKIDKNFILQNLTYRNNLQNKRILVGQPFYKTGSISIDKYIELVNYLIKKYKIDYYLPHMAESFVNNIMCDLLNISHSKLTLELYASIFDFELYGFTSSVLYTTKCINPNVMTYAFNCDFVSNNITSKFILSHVSGILNEKL